MYRLITYIFIITLFSVNVKGAKNYCEKIQKDTIRKSNDSEDLYKKSVLEKFIKRDTSNKRKSYLFSNKSLYKKESKYNYKDRLFYSESRINPNLSLRKVEILSLTNYLKKGNGITLSNYWRNKNIEESGLSVKNNKFASKTFGTKLFDALFGSNKIVIHPRGTAELSLGVKIINVENPTLPESLRKSVLMDFHENLQMNVVGSIGDRLKLDINYNTQATFDVENNVKLSYDSKDDDIIQSIEAGNVSMPLSGTLIRGGQNLFGFKTRLKFGDLNITTLFSQQKGETSVINLEKGAQQKEFELYASKYDANRHFFLSNYFVDKFETSLSQLPLVNSDIKITKLEVWVTNKNSKFDKARNILALTNLGESKNSVNNIYNLPDNNSNNLYSSIESNSSLRDIQQVNAVMQSLGYNAIYDFEKVESARMLDQTEYVFNDRLGFISLNTALNADEVLAVAYEYTLRDGTIKRVGELTTDGPSSPSVLYLKMLKSTVFSEKMPHWRLMMKNVYNIGSYGAKPEDFVLNVLFKDDVVGTELNYITVIDNVGSKGRTEKILLSLLNLDNLNRRLDAGSDGQFDYIEGITILPTKGRVIFPLLEPFGKSLKDIVQKKYKSSIDPKYLFEDIYTKPQSTAILNSQQDKYILKGHYKSTNSNEIHLNNPNIRPGGVKVVAGSRVLTENIDYVVDYAMGLVKILNQGILESGTPIQISSESNSLFSMQTKTLIGTHLDYRITDDFHLGATVMHLSESPLTEKVQFGHEPISNTVWGVNGSYSSEFPLLTKLVDAIPFIDTKAKSRINIEAEFAQLIPGHNKNIGRVGNAYIDDFEGSKITISLKSPLLWHLSSVPEDGVISNANLKNDIKIGYRRAKIAWYTVDPLFYRTEDPAMPSHIKNDRDLRSDHFTREIRQTELFPNKDVAVGTSNILSAMNIAFYPSERGPYNYNVDELTKDGELNNPEKSWGGIMRKISNSDFEASNIQYIEFWLMDPFMDDSLKETGKLCFDLGAISEDVLKDGRKAFENGLPADGNISSLDKTVWGVIPNVQSIVNGFSNKASARKYQDVGYDGLSSSQERNFSTMKNYVEKLKTKYGSNSDAYKKAFEDPSGDDFHFFRGSDYDSQQLDIRNRYKYYNNPDGNSPTSEMSNETYSTAATSKPDNEDINLDNTLSEVESFYRYVVDLSELKNYHNQDRDAINVGVNSYISDIRESEVSLPNGKREKVKWYQYRVPLTDYTKFGNIDGFRSIRYMRLLLKDCKQPVNLRFASLGLIRDKWRIHPKSFEEASTILEESSPKGKISLSAVSIEENSQKTPVNYVLPPGISREVNTSSTQYTRMNERAMVLKIKELQDGYSRQVFKNVAVDMLKYKRIKMDVHAEAVNGGIMDDDLRIFIRIGSDYLNNYYEYEIPLKLTPAGNYTNSEDDRRIVWPEANMFDFPLSYFQNIKLLRNDARRAGTSGVDYNNRYTKIVSQIINSNNGVNANNRVTVKGNPSLAEIKTIMIGVRNPKNDGIEKSAEIWVNELRLSDFDESGGWAANVRMNARLADFATLSVSGRKLSPGFGNIDQRASQLSREDYTQYDVSTNVQLGKFFPKKWKVRFPMYYSLSETTVLPEYDPVDTDIKLSDKMDRFSGSKRDSVKRNAEKYVGRKSINFTNVGVEPTGKNGLLKLSNFSVSYSYNEIKKHDIKTTRDIEKTYRGALSYVYSGRPKNVSPFRNIGFLKSKYLKLIRDFNFFYMPSQISIRTDMIRRYHEIEGRNIDNPDFLIKPSVDKDFSWNRYYDLKFDLSKSLAFDFSASSNSRIDEIEGIVDKDREPDAYKRWKDTVINNILAGGRALHYNHGFSLNYRLPINKIPFLSWVSANARYQGAYDWQASPLFNTNVEVGNVIKNSGVKELNGRLNLLSLYNKSSWLRNVNRRYSGRKVRKKKKKVVKFARRLSDIKKGKPITINHNLNTKNIKIRFYDKSRKNIEYKIEKKGKKYIKIVPLRSAKRSSLLISGNIYDKSSAGMESIGLLARLLMSVRNISFTYSETSSSTLPGFTEGVGVFNNYPGFDYIIGNTGEEYGMYAASKGWISKSNLQQSPFIVNKMKIFNGRIMIEPLRDLRVNLTFKRNFYSDYSENIVYENGVYNNINKITSGRFSMSCIGLSSSFFDISNNIEASKDVFNDFLSKREVHSTRLAKERWGSDYVNHKSTKFPAFYDGYLPSSQEVLIPSFLETYGGVDSKKLFPNLLSLLPNWSIRYTGLKKIDLIARYFQTFNINHSYSCIYNVIGYNTNMNYGAYNTLTSNYYPRYDVSGVSIEERFSPLINVDMLWKSSFTTRFEMNRKRTVSLSLANSQVSEISSNEFVIGIGYRFKHIPLIIKQTQINNSLNLRCDFSMRKNNAILRMIQENISQLTSGQEVLSLKISADYTLNNVFNIRLFYDRVVNDPYVSLAFRTTNSNFGVSVRFTLAQ